MVSELEKRAKAFATKHHDLVSQVRKYTGEPYINHPAAVAELVRGVPHTNAMLAAAWLHDVVEDTKATLSEIELEFGPEVAELVEMLTDVSKPEDGNRAVRKALDRDHLAKASPQAQTIKLADLIDNCISIAKEDPKFFKVYVLEKVELLKVLKSGDPVLFGMASKLVEQYQLDKSKE